MKKLWAIRKDAEAVSPVIATILMVAITVVLAAVLYVMVLGFGGTQQQTPTTQLTKTTVSSGVKMTLAAVSIDTLWDDVTILLSDGTDTDTWAMATENLDGGSAVTYRYTTASTNLGVFLNITDIAGNGYANQGDYFTLTGTLSATTTYTVTLIFDPTSSEITHQTFTG